MTGKNLSEEEGEWIGQIPGVITNPAWKDNGEAKVGRFIGGVIPFVAQSTFAPELTIPVLFGSGYQSQWDAAKAHGADDRTALQAGLMGGAINSVLGIPFKDAGKVVAGLFGAADTAAVSRVMSAAYESGGIAGVAGELTALRAALSRSGVANEVPAALKQAVTGGLDGVIHEITATLGQRAFDVAKRAAGDAVLFGGTTAAQNGVAQQTYDPNRPLSEGVVESALGGGLMGGLFGAVDQAKRAGATQNARESMAMAAASQARAPEAAPGYHDPFHDLFPQESGPLLSSGGNPLGSGSHEPFGVVPHAGDSRIHGGGGLIDPRYRDPFHGLVPHEDSPPIYESGSSDPASFGAHDPFRELVPTHPPHLPGPDEPLPATATGQTPPSESVHPYGGVTEEHIGQEIETPQGHRGILEKLTPRKAYFRGTDDDEPYSMLRDRVRLAGPIPSPREFGDVNYDDIGAVVETSKGRRGSLTKLTPTTATLKQKRGDPFEVPLADTRIAPNPKIREWSPISREREGVGGGAEEEAPEDENAPLSPGWFRITDWTGYPEGIPRPTDPIRMRIGEEHGNPRAGANRRNRKLHDDNPEFEGFEIHEILPIKFGGSPTDIANKMSLSPKVHN